MLHRLLQKHYQLCDRWPVEQRRQRQSLFKHVLDSRGNGHSKERMVTQGKEVIMDANLGSPKATAQIAAGFSSIGERRAARLASKSSVSLRAGNVERSTLPLVVRGNASSTRKAPGRGDQHRASAQVLNSGRQRRPREQITKGGAMSGADQITRRRRPANINTIPQAREAVALRFHRCV